MRQELTFKFDGEGSGRLLTALSELAERFPEFGDSLLGLIDSGDELFCLDSDSRSAPRAGEIVVRLNPSDRLAALMSAFRAGDFDLLAFEHDGSSVATTNKTTTRDYSQ